MSDELVKNLRNMAEYNDRREFGADYKDDIHWKAADRIDELEQDRAERIKNHNEIFDAWQRDKAIVDAIPWKEIERLVNQANTHSLVPPEQRDFRDQVLARILALREQEEGNE